MDWFPYVMKWCLKSFTMPNTGHGSEESVATPGDENVFFKPTNIGKDNANQVFGKIKDMYRIGLNAKHPCEDEWKDVRFTGASPI